MTYKGGAKRRWEEGGGQEGWRWEGWARGVEVGGGRGTRGVEMGGMGTRGVEMGGRGTRGVEMGGRGTRGVEVGDRRGTSGVEGQEGWRWEEGGTFH